jgi:hypothetical protein
LSVITMDSRSVLARHTPRLSIQLAACDDTVLM